MKKQQLREYCEAEFENIDNVISQLISLVKTEKIDYSISELAAMATFLHNCYNLNTNNKMNLLIKDVL